MEQSVKVTVNGKQEWASISYEPVIAWAIHTSKDGKDITVERVVPITVWDGLHDSCRFNARPESEDGQPISFVSKFAYDAGTGSVRFIQAEPGVRLVTVYVDHALHFDVGLEYPGRPIEVTPEFIEERVGYILHERARKVAR